MKFLLSLSVLAVASLAYGQCPTGNCPSRPGFASFQSGGLALMPTPAQVAAHQAGKTVAAASVTASSSVQITSSYSAGTRMPMLHAAVARVHDRPRMRGLVRKLFWPCS